ncbi:ABC transporter ATP-binding protein [Devosia sp. XK-2]|uniref:ABC transporter ATP-binding protein n=1 Tax=Devosia sp. XK-2 TaxID=3126689 RepID=UPI0030D1B53F
MTANSPDHEDDYETLAGKHVSVSRVLALFQPYRLQFAATLLLIVVGSGVGLVAPFLLRAVIDDALPTGNLALLAWLAGGMIAAAVVVAIINVGQTLLSSRIGHAILHDLRVRIYSHLQALSIGFFVRTRSGDIQSRIANDIGGLQSIVTATATELARNIGTVAMTTIAMILLDWRLALFSFVLVPFALWVSHRVGQKREEATHEQQTRTSELSSSVLEMLSVPGIILARTMGRTGYLGHRFRKDSRELAHLEEKAHTAGEWQWSLILVFLGVMPALTLLLGGLLINGGVPVTIGTLVALIALQEQLLWPLEELLDAGVRIRSTRALFTRIFQYLDTPVELTEPVRPATLHNNVFTGAVQITGVSYSYDKDAEPTLSDVSVDIPAGSRVAIVGATGAGKTTLGYLLARLIDVDEGAICFDGIDVRDLTFQQLADVLGVVSQEPFLLHASVADNLRFAKPDASQDDLEAAARAAQIHDLIASLPDGYATIVGERGFRFSGGEKQRLALARTFLRKTPVLLLDEATSALDARTEQAMTKALSSVKGRTIISIAHRLSTVRSADRIVVLENGRVVETGRHDELMALGEVYAGLVGHSADNRLAAKL